MSQPLPPSDEIIGRMLAGRYRVVSRLGAGGMGVAYRSWDVESGIPVVVKIPKQGYLTDGAFAERFTREVRLLQQLDHPRIVPILDVGEHDGLPFVVMRLLPGGSLANRRLRDDAGRARPNPPGMLHLWLPTIAQALDYMHALGVVHRDVKPANVFFDAFWGAFLGDFGIAKIIADGCAGDREQTLTATGLGVGTPEYMAPEQFSPKPVLDGRTDQHALAVIAYEMLVGRRPFTGDSAHLIVEVTTHQPIHLRRLIPGIPTSLADAIHRGLAKRPGDRFSSCREFAATALAHVAPLADEPGVARLLCPTPGCMNLLVLPVTAAGRKGKCPKCRAEIRVADDLSVLWLKDDADDLKADSKPGNFLMRMGSLPDRDVSWNVLEDFHPGPPERSRSLASSRRTLLGRLDSHGLILVAAIGLIASTPWVISAGRPRSKPSTLSLVAEKPRAATSRESGEDLQRRVQDREASRGPAENGAGLDQGHVARREPVFLTDLPERDGKMNFQFGKHGYSGHGAIAVMVRGQFDRRGLGMHALDDGVATVTYDVPAGVTHFEATAAINDTAGRQITPLTFGVLTDSVVRWQSQPLRGPGAVEECRVALHGAKTLTLTVQCLGKSWFCHSVWMSPRFVTN